ncbi:MAG: prepilin-type N-terminal cleavage/methylation domain-containing protein [Myxococcales bacterium]|nr:prepilin-type N-terminal cleavage/methylation domain-containing protein [Myxococcales bacterium]
MPRARDPIASRRAGLTLIELMIVSAIVAVVGGILAMMLSGMYQSWTWADRRARLYQQGRVAMARMVHNVRMTNFILVPQQHSLVNTQVLRESLAVAATGDAVYDEDSDGLFDEDTGADMTNDGEDGVIGLDDDADGQIDETSVNNDDEDKFLIFDTADEDPLDGIRASGDLDLYVDEDWGADMNGDGKPGAAGVDDDGDWTIDEGNTANDDEDTDSLGVERVNEDPISPIVYYLDKSFTPWKLMERHPIEGTNVLADNVTLFQVFRYTRTTGAHMIYIELTLKGDVGFNGEPAEVVKFATGVSPRNQPKRYVP